MNEYTEPGTFVPQSPDDPPAAGDTPIGDSIPFGTETEPQNTSTGADSTTTAHVPDTGSAPLPERDTSSEPPNVHQFQITHFEAPAGDTSVWTSWTTERMDPYEAIQFIQARAGLD